METYGRRTEKKVLKNHTHHLVAQKLRSIKVNRISTNSGLRTGTLCALSERKKSG
jgi:hypothetical protein